jgi:hypothetical protein
MLDILRFVDGFRSFHASLSGFRPLQNLQACMGPLYSQGAGGLTILPLA